MANSVEFKVDWDDATTRRRFDRAVGRGTIGVAGRVETQAKRNVHVITGDLRRSIHSAKVNTLGEELASQRNVLTSDGAITETGSWLDYACVEEVGRGHAYMMPAVESVRAVAVAIFQESFRQEGFR